MDEPGIPWDIMSLVVVVMPVCLALFFGLFTWRRMTPLAFHCSRCGGQFQRRPWKRFPAKCPLCGSRDWNKP